MKLTKYLHIIKVKYFSIINKEIYDKNLPIYLWKSKKSFSRTNNSLVEDKTELIE